MSPQVIGAFAGAALGIINYAVIQFVAARVEKETAAAGKKPVVQSGRTPKSGATGILRKIAVLDLILFPVIGYFIGPMVL